MPLYHFNPNTIFTIENYLIKSFCDYIFELTKYWMMTICQPCFRRNMQDTFIINIIIKGIISNFDVINILATNNNTFYIFTSIKCTFTNFGYTIRNIYAF